MCRLRMIRRRMTLMHPSSRTGSSRPRSAWPALAARLDWSADNSGLSAVVSRVARVCPAVTCWPTATLTTTPCRPPGSRPGRVSPGWHSRPPRASCYRGVGHLGQCGSPVAPRPSAAQAADTPATRARQPRVAEQRRGVGPTSGCRPGRIGHWHRGAGATTTGWRPRPGNLRVRLYTILPPGRGDADTGGGDGTG